jgi:hypothetical protein
MGDYGVFLIIVLVTLYLSRHWIYNLVLELRAERDKTIEQRERAARIVRLKASFNRNYARYLIQKAEVDEQARGFAEAVWASRVVGGGVGRLSSQSNTFVASSSRINGPLETETRNIISECIRAYKLLNPGATQREIAAACDTSPATVNRVLAKERKLEENEEETDDDEETDEFIDDTTWG